MAPRTQSATVEDGPERSVVVMVLPMAGRPLTPMCGSLPLAAAQEAP